MASAGIVDASPLEAGAARIWSRPTVQWGRALSPALLSLEDGHPGTTELHSHQLMVAQVQGHGLILFCAKCGAYAWKRAQQLKKRCLGSSAGKGLLSQRDLLAKGLFPSRAWTGPGLGPARRPTPAAADWLAWQQPRQNCSKHAAFDEPALRAMAPCDILACYGLDDESARLQALRAKRLSSSARRPLLCSQSETASSSDEDPW